MKKLLKCKIKKIENFKDFKEVFKDYSAFPYYEEWGTEEIRNEYNFHLENGYIFGCYCNEKCVGIISMGNAELYEHPIHFPNPKKAIYISNMIVKSDYRYHGFGTKLAEFAVDFAKDNGYEFIYFRYREQYELGKEIAKKLGFSKHYDICEEVRKPRVENSYMKNQDTDLRFFMSKKI